MPSPLGVTIDAGVLAVPHIDCPREDVFKYVDTLLDWSKLLDAHWVDIYMSERASGSLLEADLYPQGEHLKKLFNTHGIIEYDVNTVMKIVNSLLKRTPSFEMHYRVKDVWCENLETDPDVIRLALHNELRSDLARCITLLAILRKHWPQPLGGHTLILRNAPQQIIQVKAHILYLDHSREDIPELPCPPACFEGDVLVCDDFQSLINSLDETAILIGASDDLGIELAIRIALFKNDIAQDELPDWDDVPVPIIGEKFRELCQKICANQGDAVPPKILRAIVETVKKNNLSAVHALRTGEGGNNPQRKRGLDKAQRRDIDRELHLHYWECADGKIELASVVYHNDFSIPE